LARVTRSTYASGDSPGTCRFERLDVLVGVGEQQLVTDTDLVEQLASARALRRQIDEAGTACASGDAHSR
jgi:hypothetical protein